MMNHNHYNWSNGPAELKDHSKTKHELLSAYLFKYLLTLNKFVGKTEFRLTIVDGFSGGGLYENSGEIIPGSPLIALETVRAAASVINDGRSNAVKLDVDYWFVDSSSSACDFLKETLRQRNWLPSNDIRIVNSKFTLSLDAILTTIRRKSPISGRSIFVLDQYGYSEVPLEALRRIFRALPKAEIILTFHFDSLARYASDSNLRAIETTLGMDSLFGNASIKDIKRERPKTWRAYLQSLLYHRITRGAGAKYYTPFFIKSDTGGGDYWLLHLSMHSMARDVMTGVHWELANRFVHYGGAGIDMFHAGYITSADTRFCGQTGFSFDVDARSQSIEALTKQIPKLIDERPGISVAELYADVCNSMPATKAQLKDALSILSAHGEITVMSVQDTQRRRSRAARSNGNKIFKPIKIADDDRLERARQSRIIL